MRCGRRGGTPSCPWKKHNNDIRCSAYEYRLANQPCFAYKQSIKGYPFMKNLPIYGAARRLAVFSVFRSGQKHAASKKTHGPNDRALHFLTSASGMAKPTGTAHSVSDLAPRAAFPRRPGITVTFSRGLSPHSAAGFCFRSPAHRPCIQFT